MILQLCFCWFILFEAIDAVGTCPGDQVWTSCGSPCNRTCEIPSPFCLSMCVTRCQCPSDKPLDMGEGVCGQQTDCVCPVGQSLVTCVDDPCLTKPSCIAWYPRAHCVVSQCGVCSASWYTDCTHENEINCNVPITECPTGYMPDEFDKMKDFLTASLIKQVSYDVVKNGKNALRYSAGGNGQISIDRQPATVWYEVVFEPMWNVLTSGISFKLSSDDANSVEIVWTDVAKNVVATQKLFNDFSSPRWWSVEVPFVQWLNAYKVQITVEQFGTSGPVLKNVYGVVCKMLR